MKFAFELVKFFPYGGVQLDMLRMAESCVVRGHKVVIFCASWEGEKPDFAEVRVLKLSSFTNHGRIAELGEKVYSEVQKEGGYSGIVGFVRTVHLDVFFAGDNCFLDLLEKKNFFSRYLSPRHRKLAALEAAVFSPAAKTVAMLIVPEQLEGYRRRYRLDASRLKLLPPGIQDSCRYPASQNEAENIRRKFRKDHGIKEDEFLICLVGSNLKRKGGDRLLAACAMLDAGKKKNITVALAGADSQTWMNRQIIQSGVRVLPLGRCDEVKSLLLASDLMVHPAREEAAGSVLLEAITLHLPVICTENCGFSSFIRESGGKTVKENADSEELAEAITQALNHLDDLRKQVAEYAGKHDFHSRAAKAAEIIEEVCAAKEKDCI